IYKVDEGTAKDIESTAQVNEGTDEVNENTVRRFIEDVITKTVDYHLFDIVVEFHRCVFLSYPLLKDNLFVLKWCDEDLSKSSKGV
ncbi:hypothetical protein Tco_0182402, partial [Tanacetum coccineum]